MSDEKKGLRCPKCGALVKEYQNPFPTVDIIIAKENKVVLILRRNEPRQWALPGGFCDYGESLEEAAIREAREETGLQVELLEQFHTYSDPQRDPRQHNITTVFTARVVGGTVQAQDDAQDVRFFSEEELPPVLAFDHLEILNDYFLYKRKDRRRRL